MSSDEKACTLNRQTTGEKVKTKVLEIRKWVNEHKVQIVIGVTATTGTATLFKNHDAITTWFHTLYLNEKSTKPVIEAVVKQEVESVSTMLSKGLSDIVANFKKKPPIYSKEWFDSFSVPELEDLREDIRKKYLSSGKDMRTAIRLENLLYLFDNVLSERAWANSSEYGYPVHSEHGWYLSSDD